MIVDDEQDIRERLKSMIEWERLSLNMVCEAGDSDSAQDMFILYKPKIVIMDINIPIISGIELAKQFLAIDAETRFIIITGFTDFEFVKSSVKLGAVDLISKPIMPDEINQSLESLINYFRKIGEEHANSILINELIAENRPMLIKQTISSLLLSDRNLSDRNGGTDKQLKRLKALYPELERRKAAVVIIVCEQDGNEALGFDSILVAVRNITDELLKSAGFSVYTYFDDLSNLVCTVSWDTGEGDEELEKAIHLIREKLSFYYGIHIIAGIGQPVDSLEGLRDSYQKAKMAYSNKSALEGEKIISFRDIAQIDVPVVLNTDTVIKELSILFREGREPEITQIINSFCTVKGGIDEASGQSYAEWLEKIREFAFSYIAGLVSDCISLGIGSPAINKLPGALVKLSTLADPHSVSVCLTELTKDLLEEFSRKRSKNKNQLIGHSKAYIDQHLSDMHMNLDKVSRHIGLSSVYFCKLFHKEAGISFNDYLNTARVEKAKELLLQTPLKVYEVGEAVGYSNVQYFNYVFKRFSGFTPLEYKNSGISV